MPNKFLKSAGHGASSSDLVSNDSSALESFKSLQENSMCLYRSRYNICQTQYDMRRKLLSRKLSIALSG